MWDDRGGQNLENIDFLGFEVFQRGRPNLSYQ